MTILSKIRKMFRRKPKPSKVFSYEDIGYRIDSAHDPFGSSTYIVYYVVLSRPPKSEWTDDVTVKATHMATVDLLGTVDVERIKFILKHELTFTLDDSFNIILSDDDETLFRVTRP